MISYRLIGAAEGVDAPRTSITTVDRLWPDVTRLDARGPRRTDPDTARRARPPLPTVTWTPPPRPQWVADLVVAGAELDPLALAPLDPDELFATACRRVGADDMGGVSWQTGLESLCGALATEAHLHAVGAILTRSEILRTLANRLRIVAAESDDEPALTTPWFVTGTARSGTSILHELLALDPRSRTPATWEVLDSVPAPDGGAPADDRVAGIEGAVQWWNDIAPEYLTMHENGAALPTECIFVTAHEFSSEHWSGVHDVPSYHRWTARTGAGAAYAWHRRHLGFLQSRQGPQQWVLKAPSHLGTLPALFAEYPDAWVIQTHRDPLRTVPSTISLMATLRWMRSDAVDVTRLAPTMANGVAMLFELGPRDARTAPCPTSGSSTSRTRT